MPENKTSKAVDFMLDQIDKAADDPRFYFKIAEGDVVKLKKVLQRFKQIESALDRLVFLHHCEQEGLKQPEFKEWVNAVDQAEKALFFDPL